MAGTGCGGRADHIASRGSGGTRLSTGRVLASGAGGRADSVAGLAAQLEVDKCLLTHYVLQMIRSFRHRGLKRFYERGDRSLIRPDLHDRVEAMLAQLDVAGFPEAMRLPHYRLHALKGGRKGYWSVTVKANWRLVFRFENADVHDVELIDYH